MSVFLRVRGADDPAECLRGAACSGESGIRYTRDPESLRSIPSSPFVYWVEEGVTELFTRLRPVEEEIDLPRQGLTTANDFRFVRACWEVPAGQTGKRWHLLAKGSSMSPFYVPIHVLANWEAGGRECQAYIRHRYPYLSGVDHVAKNATSYFRPGVVWPRRPHRRGTFSHLAPGAIFSENGPILQPEHSSHWEVLALLNSSPFAGLLHLLMARGTAGSSQSLKYEAGYVGAVPVPQEFPGKYGVELSGLARRGWSLARSLDLGDETSHAFVIPGLLAMEGASFGARMRSLSEHVGAVEASLAEVRAQIDELCFELYQLGGEDRAALVEDLGGGDSSDEGLDRTFEAAQLVSWCFGVAAGRFDVRLVTGQREWPEEPDPFASLPVCSPGMLTGEDGLLLAAAPEGYPVEVSPVLVDDPGDLRDVTERVRSVFGVVFGEQADAWWADIGEMLGAKGREVGAWLSKGFFEHHLKTHSKSRRKAPIYWPLGTASGSYLVWLYAHRATSDSLLRVLADHVSPKLVAERRRLSELVQEAGSNPSASQRKDIDGQERFVVELQDLADELTSVAPLWHPDLNDGIVVVLAPLWRVFAHHKPWSKELRKHWDKLAAGEYDWAQLAMRLWPERVVPKCAVDRSLAIAHGLEDVFWIQQDALDDDSWDQRSTPTRSVDDLIADRTDPTIKAALEAIR